MTPALARRVWQARTLGAALLLPPLLSLVSFQRLASRVGRPGPARPAPVPDDASFAWWVEVVLGHLPPPWHSTCLKRSVVLFHLLRRAGRAVSLCIGVRRDAGGAFVAHAWLTQDGAPYLEPPLSQPATFQVIATFPEERRGAR